MYTNDTFIRDSTYIEMIAIRLAIANPRFLDKDEWERAGKLGDVSLWQDSTVEVADDVGVATFLYNYSDNSHVILAASKENAEVVKYATQRFRETEALVIQLVSQNGLVLEFVSDNLRRKASVVFQALIQNATSIKYVQGGIAVFAPLFIASLKFEPKYRLPEWKKKRDGIRGTLSKYGAGTTERILSIFYKKCIEDLTIRYHKEQINQQLKEVMDLPDEAIDRNVAIKRLKNMKPNDTVKTLYNIITHGPEHRRLVDALLDDRRHRPGTPPPGDIGSQPVSIPIDYRKAGRTFYENVRRMAIDILRDIVFQDIQKRALGLQVSLLNKQSSLETQLREVNERMAEEDFETSSETKKDLASDKMAVRADYAIVSQQLAQLSIVNFKRQASLELMARGTLRLKLIDLLAFFPDGVAKAVLEGQQQLRSAAGGGDLSKITETALVKVRALLGGVDPRWEDWRFLSGPLATGALSEKGVEFVASGPVKPALQPNAYPNASDEEEDVVVHLTCAECGINSRVTRGGLMFWQKANGLDFCSHGTKVPDCLDSYWDRINHLYHPAQGYVELPPSTDLKAKGSNVHLETSVKLEEAASAVHHSLASNSAEKALAIFAEDLVREDVEDLEDGIRGDLISNGVSHSQDDVEVAEDLTRLEDAQAPSNAAPLGADALSSLVSDLNIRDETQVGYNDFKTSEYDLDELDDFYADSGSGMSFEEIGASSSLDSELDNLPFETQLQDMMRF
jgi:hypothetical protein